MSEENTQAVVDTVDTTAQPVVQTQDAREDGDSLESLLAQFDQSTKTEAVSPPATQQADQTKVAPVIDPDRLNRIEQRLFKEDLDRTVANIVGDSKVPDKWARGWIDQVARERPALQQAFLNRDSNPQAWAKIERSLAKEFSKEFEQITSIDRNVSEDVAVVAAAVRGASTKAPENKPPKMDGMSNAEFRKFTLENYGFDPG